ncbi:MAG: hypothetical protein AB7J46_06285 [Candidatus Altimarinota bacterium]
MSLSISVRQFRHRQETDTVKNLAAVGNLGEIFKTFLKVWIPPL